jgi:hypothetical protein
MSRSERDVLPDAMCAKLPVSLFWEARAAELRVGC